MRVHAWGLACICKIMIDSGAYDIRSYESLYPFPIGILVPAYLAAFPIGIPSTSHG